MNSFCSFKLASFFAELLIKRKTVLLPISNWYRKLNITTLFTLTLGLSTGCFIEIQAQLNLDISTTPTIRFDGYDGHSQLGYSINHGDINGDGYTDLILGAPLSSEPAVLDRAGSVFVVFGDENILDQALDLRILNGNNGFRINGVNPRQQVGLSLTTLDINADGILDIVLSAGDGYSNETGSLFVVFGSTSGFNSDIPVDSLDGSNGFKVTGLKNFPTNAQNFNAKSTVSLASGDVNADGIDDLIIGQPSDSRTDILFGSTTSFGSTFDLSAIDGTNGLNTTPLNDFSKFGSSVASGDINGDNIDDIIIGERGSNNGRGRTYIAFGSSNLSNPIRLDSLNGTNGFTVFPSRTISKTGGMGNSVASGDINADNIDDIIIGAPLTYVPHPGVVSHTQSEGEVNIIFGKNSGHENEFKLDSLNGSNGFSLIGDYSNKLGTIVESGDVNGDNIDDVLVYSSFISSYSGRVNIILGKSSSFQKQLNITDTDIVITGNSYDYLGTSMAVGDLDNDGINEVLLGAPMEQHIYYSGHAIVYPLSKHYSSLTNTSQISENNYTFNFDYELRTSSVNNSSIKMHGDNTGWYNGNVVLNDSKSITFTPSKQLEPGEKITILADTSIKSYLGSSLSKNHQFHFTAESDSALPFKTNQITVSNTVSNPVSIVSADIDKDGDIDVVSTATAGNSIVWHRNNGNGTFNRFTVANLSNGINKPDLVQTADVDRDGDMDIVSASSQAGTIHLFENNGNQNFITHLLSDSSDGINDFSLKDINGDGLSDIFGTSSTNSKLFLLLNQGNLLFKENTIGIGLAGISDVLVSDIDSDFDIDLVISSSQYDSLVWFQNNGLTVFTKKMIGVGISGITSIDAADIDSDGDIDLITASQTTGSINWIKNDGDQNFTLQNIDSHITNINQLLLGDYDGDNDIDIITTGVNNSRIKIYNNQSNASFIPLSLGENHNEISSINLADINNDNRLDIVTSDIHQNLIVAHTSVSYSDFSFSRTTFPSTLQRDSSISMVFNHPLDSTSVNDSTFFVNSKLMGKTEGTISIIDSLITFQPNSSFIPGDKINITITDSLKNIFDQKSDDPSITFSFNIASKRIIPSGTFLPHLISQDYSSPLFAIPSDINLDGFTDIVTLSSTKETIKWMENNGSENFSDHIITDDETANFTSLFVADLNSDGRPDIITGSLFDHDIWWFENSDDQVFTKRLVSTDAQNIRSIFVHDLDNDGKLDIIAALFSGQIAWYRNTGNENFTKITISNTYVGATSVFASDIDSDGDIDVVGADYTNRVLLLENDGFGTFTQKTISANFSTPIYVTAADMDNDGDQDILVASFKGNKVFLLTNNGNQSFSKQLIISSFIRPSSIQTGDIDGDGDVDIVASSSGSNKISLIYNNSGNNFTSSNVITGIYNPRLAELADMDNDGDLDVIGITEGNGGATTATWFELIPSSGNASISFNGTDNFIDADSIASLLSGSSTFTFEAWIKPDFINQSDPNDVTVLSITPSGSRIYIGNNANKDQIIRVTGNSVLTGPTLSNNSWTHVAYTINAGTGRLYVNGEAAGTHSTATSFSHDQDWNVGAIGSPGLLLDIFAGSLDELRFWNTARSAEEIRRNMFQRAPKNAPGLVAYFPLDEASGSTIYDRSSNTIRAALEGAPGWSSDAHPHGTFITGSEGWRILTAPAANVSFSTMLDTLWTQGFTGADVLNGTSNLYTWSEPSSTFNAVVNGNTTPAAGKAFITYVYDDQDNDGTADGFPKMIRIDSTQHTGDISPTLSYTDNGTPANDGWNLVGNPYGTSIDWDAPNGLSRNNLDASLYVWNHSAGGGNGAYQSWNGVAGTLSDGKLAPLQGFWVKANNANPSINFSALARSTGGVFRKEQVAQSVPQLTFTLSDSSGSSQTLVMFHEQALLGKDPYDAYKLGSLNGESLALYSLLEDSSALEINALPLDFNQPLDIPVSYSGSSEINFSLSWEHKLLPEEWEFALIDNIAETTIDLKTDSVYTFSQDSSKAKKITAADLTPPAPPQLSPRPLKGKATAEEPRFTMRVSKASAVSTEAEQELPAKVELSQNYPNPFNPSTTIGFGLPQTGKVTLEVFDILGRRVATLLNGENKSAGRHSITFDARNLASGMYIYRLRAGNSVIIKKLTLIK